MNGKVIVAGMGVIGVIMLILGTIFTTGETTPDQRFSRRRIGLPENTEGPRLLSERVADYNRTAFTPLENDPATGLPRGTAVYQELDYGKDVHFEIARVADDARKALRVLYDANPATTKTYIQDPVTDYAYLVTDQADGTKRYEFMWTNNKWILRVWTTQTNADALLRWANSYRF